MVIHIIKAYSHNKSNTATSHTMTKSYIFDKFNISEVTERRAHVSRKRSLHWSSYTSIDNKSFRIASETDSLIEYPLKRLSSVRMSTTQDILVLDPESFDPENVELVAGQCRM